ncbi:MAG: hypothetical protein FWE86_04060, partial [Oscillospiraceae bacterium]|nr:hypothetical protein [Oscillospiraceae bacterium]
FGNDQPGDRQPNRKQVTARRATAPPPPQGDPGQEDRMPVRFPDEPPPPRNAPVMPADGAPQRKGGFTVDVGDDMTDDVAASARRSRFSPGYSDDVDVPPGNFADVRVDPIDEDLPPTGPASLFRR